MNTQTDASASAPVQSAQPTHTGIFAPLRASRNFTALWTGQTLSRFGDVLLHFLLPLIVYEVSASTMAMGTMMMLIMLPQVILLPFAGLLVDRTDRVRLMILTDVVRFAAMGVLTVLSALDMLTLPMLYAFGAVMGACSAIFLPAYGAVRAQVFTPDIRNAANSLTQSSTQVAQLIGPSLGGLMLGVTTATVGLGFDSLTFLASIGGLLLLKLPKTVRSEEKRAGGFRAYRDDLLGGYQEIRKHAWLWMTILCFGFVNVFSGGVLAVLLPWLVKVHLGWEPYAYGLIISASGLGALIMAFLFGRRAVWKNRGIMAYSGTGMTGLALLLMGVVDWLPGLIALSALSGAGIMLFGLVWEGSLQELIPAEAFGRVMSLDMLGSFALMPLGYLLAGWLAERIGGLTTMILEGTVILVMAALMLTLKPIRQFQ